MNKNGLLDLKFKTAQCAGLARLAGFALAERTQETLQQLAERVQNSNEAFASAFFSSSLGEVMKKFPAAVSQFFRSFAGVTSNAPRPSFGTFAPIAS